MHVSYLVGKRPKFWSESLSNSIVSNTVNDTREICFSPELFYGRKSLSHTVVTAQAIEEFRKLTQKSTHRHEKHSQTHAAGMVSR